MITLKLQSQLTSNLILSLHDLKESDFRTHQVAWHSWGVLEKSVGDFQAAKDCWIKGIKYAEGIPTPYLYQSLALLSSELEMYDAAREWFKRGTGQVTGFKSYALWHEWAVMEAKLGNYERMEELFKKTLKVIPRIIHLNNPCFSGQ